MVQNGLTPMSGAWTGTAEASLVAEAEIPATGEGKGRTQAFPPHGLIC